MHSVLVPHSAGVLHGGGLPPLLEELPPVLEELPPALEELPSALEALLSAPESPELPELPVVGWPPDADPPSPAPELAGR